MTHLRDLNRKAAVDGLRKRIRELCEEEIRVEAEMREDAPPNSYGAGACTGAIGAYETVLRSLREDE